MTTDVYKAEQEDEISLEVGETIEVIHKLLDGWWVVRYDKHKNYTTTTITLHSMLNSSSTRLALVGLGERKLIIETGL